MLIDVAPIVLPPLTVPTNVAPGLIVTVLVKPAARLTARPVLVLAAMVAALRTVPAPPVIWTPPVPPIEPPV